MNETLKKWNGLYEEVMSKGFMGMRVIGDASWVKPEDWKALVEYESHVNSFIKDHNLTALCAFNIKDLKSIIHISDIVSSHEACFVSV